MKKITLRVHDEYVDGGGVVCGAKGSSEATTLRVEFENWDNLSKYATFHNSLGQYDLMTILTIDLEVEPNIYEFPIPTEAMDEEGLLSVAFTGYTYADGNLGALENTATAYLRVLPSIGDIHLDDESMHSSLAQQLQAEMDMLKTDYNALPEAVAQAATYANNSYNSSINSATSAENAAASAQNSATSANTALGYKNQTQAIYNSVEGGFVVCGSVAFEDLPSLADCSVGFMYEITDDFETTSDFEEGAGVEHVAGTSVYKTNNNKWAVRVADVATLQAEVDDLETTVSGISGNLTDLGGSVSALTTTVAGKVDKVEGKGLSTEDYSSDEKTKLSGIEAEANKTTVDVSLDSQSGNPISNNAVVAALANKSNALLVRNISFNGFGPTSIWSAGEYQRTQEISLDVSYSGYTPIGIVGITPKNAEYPNIAYFYINGNTAKIGFYQFRADFGNVDPWGYGDTTISAIKVLYLKNS